jgi:ATP-dependent protease Clp ATPase subunit
MKRRRLPRLTLYCSFCGKNENEVFTLCAGPNVFICDECVAAANQTVTDRKLAAGVSVVISRMAKSEA